MHKHAALRGCRQTEEERGYAFRPERHPGSPTRLHGSAIMKELDFIAALRALPLHPGARGLADDVAVIEIGGETLVVTHDSMVEDIHFLPHQDPADVAWKLVATNMSDLAAKGAEPIGVILSYMLNSGDTRFAEGLHEALEHFGVGLLGGDTVSGAKSRVFGLTALGRATHTPVPARSGAQMGDGLWVTGKVGEALLGFEAIKAGSSTDSTAYRRPMARLGEGQALAPLVTAMMDISDGLLLDAFRIAEASALSIAIEGKQVPVARPERRMDCLTWGDDYELLFTLPAEAEPPVPATRIGAVEAQGFVPLFLDGVPIASAQGLGFRHE